MDILHVIHTEGNPIMPDQPVDGVRARAIDRIHQEELDRLEAQIATYELDRANAIYFTEELCAKWGANHVVEWAIRWATRNGKQV